MLHKSAHNLPIKKLNDLIDMDQFSLSYFKIDDAIAAIQLAGQGAGLCKTDIVDAFKLIPINDFPLLVRSRET